MLQVNLNKFFVLLLTVLQSLQFIKCALSTDEIIALTRDHRARENPDALFNGFIPVWAIVIYTISAIVSGVCYLAGCRNPHGHKVIRVVSHS